MGCCNNKAGCDKNNKMTDSMSFSLSGLSVEQTKELMTGLSAIASAGLRAGIVLRNSMLQNPFIAKLAKQISDLAIENAYLKSVLNLFSPMDIGITGSDFVINFGPGQKYSLTLPLTDSNSRTEIAKQLRTAADKLEAELETHKANRNPEQTLFPFANPQEE